MKILIVEDDADLRTLLTRKLEDRKHKVLLATDGKEGLEVAYKNKPDLILLDLLMPTMSGEDFLKELRTDEWGKSAQVVVITNYSVNEDLANQLKELGIDEFLIKAEYSLSELIDQLVEKGFIK